MKLKAEKNFQDMEAKVRRVVGDIFEVSDERGKELLAHPQEIVSRVFDAEVIEDQSTSDLTPPLQTPESIKEAQEFNRNPIEPTPNSDEKTSETQEESQNVDLPKAEQTQPQASTENPPVGSEIELAPTEKVVVNSPENRPDASIVTPPVKSKSQLRREAIQKKVAENKAKTSKRRYAGAKGKKK